MSNNQTKEHEKDILQPETLSRTDNTDHDNISTESIDERLETTYYKNISDFTQNTIKLLVIAKYIR